MTSFENMLKKAKILETATKSIVRQYVRGFYDLQKLRIATGNRLCASFFVRIGIKPGEKTEEAESWGKEILKHFIEEYTLLSEFIATNRKRLSSVLDKHDGVISTEAEYSLVGAYLALKDQEAILKKSVGKYVERFPIWQVFFSKISGVGPLMAGVIISEYDIYKAGYVSSMWKYAGIDVVDGEGRSRKEAHLVNREYLDSNGETKIKRGISFNPFLKTKLLGVLGPSILKQHGKKDNKYGTIYYDYKNRLERRRDILVMKYEKKGFTLEDSEKVARKEWPSARMHHAAIRYMIKMLIQDLYPVWKKLEGLPAAPSYAEAKLGLVHNHLDPVAVLRLPSRETV